MGVITGQPDSSLGVRATGHGLWTQALLACGAASLVLYVAMDVTAAFLYDGYSYTDQVISELSAVGAPTRWFWVSLGVIYALLMIAFGLGVWLAARGKRSLRVVAVMAGLVGFVALVAWPFAPMHQREVLAAGGGNFSDTMHLVLSGVDGVLLTVSIVFGAGALGRQFRVYSIATLAGVVVFSILMGIQSPGVAKDESTPWIGVTERILVFGSMLWYAVLAVALVRRERGRSQAP